MQVLFASVPGMQHPYKLHAHTYMYYVSTLTFFTLEHVFTMFERDGFFKKFGKKWFFPSIKSAMDFVLHGGRLVSH